MSELDYEKVIGYAQKFNRWKQERVPRDDYAYRNECCLAFEHLRPQNAKDDGLLQSKA